LLVPGDVVGGATVVVLVVVGTLVGGVVVAEVAVGWVVGGVVAVVVAGEPQAVTARAITSRTSMGISNLFILYSSIIFIEYLVNRSGGLKSALTVLSVNYIV